MTNQKSLECGKLLNDVPNSPPKQTFVPCFGRTKNVFGSYSELVFLDICFGPSYDDASSLLLPPPHCERVSMSVWCPRYPITTTYVGCLQPICISTLYICFCWKAEEAAWQQQQKAASWLDRWMSWVNVRSIRQFMASYIRLMARYILWHLKELRIKMIYYSWLEKLNSLKVWSLQYTDGCSFCAFSFKSWPTFGFQMFFYILDHLSKCTRLGRYV